MKTYTYIYIFVTVYEDILYMCPMYVIMNLESNYHSLNMNYDSYLIYAYIIVIDDQSMVLMNYSLVN